MCYCIQLDKSLKQHTEIKKNIIPINENAIMNLQ